MCYLKPRRKSSILRYFMGKYDDNIIWIRSIMLLFHRFRNEVTEVHNNAMILDKEKEVSKG